MMPGKKSGCGCRVAGEAEAHGVLALGLLVLLLARRRAWV
jgi:MYXO-CTERM domain-containing protein